MSSSQADQQGQDVPAAANSMMASQDARISEFRSFQEEMDRCDAEEAKALAAAVSADPPVPVEGSEITPDELTSVTADPATVEPSGLPEAPPLGESGTSAAPSEVESVMIPEPITLIDLESAAVSKPATPVEVEPVATSKPAIPVEVEPAVISRPRPPARRVIVCGLTAASATAAAPPKGRKRPCANPDAPKRKRCARASEAGPSSSKAPGSGLMPQHRAKFVSLIDGMISECGSEMERLTKELAESHERSAQLEGKLKVIEDVHSAEVSQLEARISDLERDLGKTASSLLKAKEEKKEKSSELRRLRRKMKCVEGSTARESVKGVCVEGDCLEPVPATERVLQPGADESEAPEIVEEDEGAVASAGEAMDEDEAPCEEGV